MPMNPATSVIKHWVILCFINCILPSVCIIVSEISMPLRRLCITFNRSLDRQLSPRLVLDKVTSSDADEDFVHTCWVSAMSFFPAGYSIVKWFPTISSPLSLSSVSSPYQPDKLPIKFNYKPNGHTSWSDLPSSALSSTKVLEEGRR